MCSNYVNPETCSFNNCWWRWKGIKQDEQTKEPVRFSSEWKYVDNILISIRVEHVHGDNLY